MKEVDNTIHSRTRRLGRFLSWTKPYHSIPFLFFSSSVICSTLSLSSSLLASLCLLPLLPVSSSRSQRGNTDEFELLLIPYNTMALVRCGSSRKRVVSLIAILLLATLAFIPSALCRPVPSGWDVSSSTGSSDSTLWRPFSTKTQALSYHRLLLDMEKSLEVVKNLPEKKSDTEETESTEPDGEDMFTTMDYANPRSNASGSSDDLSPPLP